MANSKSAAKRMRQTKVRTLENKARKTRIKTYRKKVTDAIESGDSTKATADLKTLFSALDKAVKSGTIHRNQANRLKSRYDRSVRFRLKAAS